MASPSPAQELPPGTDLTANRNREMLIMDIIMIILPLVAVAVRFWSRSLTPDQRYNSTLGSRFWWDDWFVLLSWFTMTAMNGIGFRLFQLGLGRHVMVVKPSLDDISEFLNLLWINELLFHLGVTFVKSAAVLFYTRIFDIGKASKYHWALRVTHILVWLWLPASWLATIFQCVPIQKAWQPWLTYGHCLREDSLWLGIAIPNLVLGIVILVLPLPKVWKLRIKTPAKLALTAIFILGYGAFIVTLGQTIVLVRAGPTLGDDLTWNSVNYIMWLMTSIPIAIITVCLPASVFLFRRAKKHGLASLLHTQVRSYAIPLHDTGYGRSTSDKWPGTSNSHNDHSIDRPTSGLDEQTYQVKVGKSSSRGSSATNLVSPDAQRGISVRYDVEITRRDTENRALQ